MKAYKTQAQNPNAPEGIPQEYPWQVQDCTEDQHDQLLADGFTMLEDSDYESMMLVQQPLFDAWYTPSKFLKEIPDVTPRQIRDMLLTMGITDAMIEAKINEIPDQLIRGKAMNAWLYSTAWQRGNLFVIQVGATLGLSPDQMDQIWLAASKM